MNETNQLPKFPEWCVYACIAGFFFILGLAIQAKVSVKLMQCDPNEVQAIQEKTK